ncbi:MAG: formyltransferase family protein [Thermoanaerobaculia bacterium]
MKFRTLRVAVLTSKRAPGLEQLLQHPQRNKLFEIAGVISTEPSLAQAEDIERAGVPLLLHPLRRFCDDYGVSVRNCVARWAYDRQTANILRMRNVDTVLLLGYHYLLTEPILKEFPERILNIHDSDLSIRRPDGERCYVGLHSTRDAILAGERVTRSTVHIVTQRLEAGPMVLMSDGYHVPAAATNAALLGDVESVRKHALAQRQMMMNDWGTLAARGLEYIASGMCEDGVIDGSDAFAFEEATVAL